MTDWMLWFVAHCKWLVIGFIALAALIVTREGIKICRIEEEKNGK